MSGSGVGHRDAGEGTADVNALHWGCVCEEELQAASVLTAESLRGKMEEGNWKRHSGPFLAGSCGVTEDSEGDRNSRRTLSNPGVR